jgi:hypothetical protein
MALRGGMRDSFRAPGVAERGKARAADDLGLGHQRLDHRLERRRTEDHRLLAAARVQQPVGEDVAALAVGAQLRFVERDEGEDRRRRHGFGRAQQPARVLRLDPLLAGDQRDPVLALDRADPVIDLARQQPQRKADRADEWAQSRSIARWVLPVLVGPSTALIRVSPVPGLAPIDVAACPFCSAARCGTARPRGQARRGHIPAIRRGNDRHLSHWLTLLVQKPQRCGSPREMSACSSARS